METRIDKFLGGQVATFTRTLAELAVRAEPDETPSSESLLDELIQAIQTMLGECARLERVLEPDRELVRQAQVRFREAIWPWFGQSWFMERALSKPRGYPGDYEMLSAIYDGVVKSRGLGGYLDRYFLGTTLGRAVPARLRALRRFLLAELNRRAGDLEVLDVACGPCREYVDHFAPLNHRRIDLIWVDNDRAALDFAAAHVAPFLSVGLVPRCERYNALRMVSVRHNVEKFGRPDIIYSVGLCDYLRDESLIPLLRAWRASVRAGGAVYVAFKDAARYNKVTYQWLVDWFFLQRSEDDCWRLFEQAGFELDQLDMTRDATGVILNFVARLPAETTYRVDPAEVARRSAAAEMSAATSVPPSP